MGNTLSMAPPERPRNQDEELAMKIKDDFTVVAVGDLLQMVPIACRTDPDIQALVQLMRAADMTLANNECTVIDRRTFRGTIAHQNAMPDVADDWANMGIKMVTKANNHTHASGDAGLIQNWEQLHRVGIEYAGADYNLEEARLARFKTTPKGISGLVGVYAEVEDYSQWSGIAAGNAVPVTQEQLDQLQRIRQSILDRRGEVPVPVDDPELNIEGAVQVFGRIFHVPDATEAVDKYLTSITNRIQQHKASKGTTTTKANSLRLKLSQLRAMAGVEDDGTDTLSAFGIRFTVTPGPGELRYDMDAQDLRDILREIRSGAQCSDFLAVTVHWHQNRSLFQHYSFDHYPSDYQIEFAHAAIDSGADLFFAHGVHTLKGVEIYKGKAIFYGLSNYIFHNQLFRSWRDHGHREPTSLDGPIMGDSEFNERRWQWLQRKQNMQALLTRTCYHDGKLDEVRLYPADLGLTPRVGTEWGTPKRPTPELARTMLQDIVEFSKPFGTEVDIIDGVGIVRLP
ncbi:hypothetical protein EDD36DRAFT_458905 [Exophiala viscosa]|uniref:Capsule synthesis protein CapA domain-containing protein n=1 Tax=Exophiala viscosa TaxID=2486360 RepID=A0AAN6DLN3_9EURO|nr:hypothetical protein EDD36DRAFT_458905 [Exophiala viscosa]